MPGTMLNQGKPEKQRVSAGHARHARCQAARGWEALPAASTDPHLIMRLPPCRTEQEQKPQGVLQGWEAAPSNVHGWSPEQCRGPTGRSQAELGHRSMLRDRRAGPSVEQVCCIAGMDQELAATHHDTSALQDTSPCPSTPLTHQPLRKSSHRCCIVTAVTMSQEGEHEQSSQMPHRLQRAVK